jgi:CheY-like chemotaxis protein
MKILIVEDEASFRLLVGDFLKEHGHDVIFADDGQEGIHLILRERVDLVISDLHMHRMDGIKFLKSARALPGLHDLPFLMISAFEDEGAIRTINSFRNTSFLRKGTEMQEMYEAVSLLAAGRRHVGDTAAAPGTAAASGNKLKKPQESLILVVDDDEALRKTLTLILEDEGYPVVAAADGFEAMELVQKQTFDLVLLDIVMPSISGFDVLKFIKEKTPSTAVVMITAFSELKLAVDAKKLGASDFVAKPFMTRDLLDTIDQALSK